ncbi:MAG: tetraacyldisaccharide 4'-kinase, partial [Bacteroidota bacterium]
VHRDFNIAVVPADELSARTWLIPAGNRRESYGALHRAHLVVVSRCKDEQALRSASGQLAQWTNGPVVGMRMQPVSFRNALDGVPKEMIELVGKKVVAFSGIGNPTSFEESLRSLSVDVRLHHRFTDHHRYTAGELEKIKSSFQNEQGDFIVTTEKDVARLRGEKNIAAAFFEQNPVYYLEIQPVFVAGEDVWKKYLEKF